MTSVMHVGATTLIKDLNVPAVFQQQKKMDHHELKHCHAAAEIEPHILEKPSEKQNNENRSIEKAEAVVIPDLFVSFMAQYPRPNPYHEEVKRESVAWMMDICGWSEKEYNKHMKADFPYFAAIWTTEAGRREFRTIVDWCNWVFDFDDLFDDGYLNENPAGAREEVESLIRLMTVSDHPAYLANEHPLRHVFQSDWLRVSQASSIGVQRRFVKSMEGFFSGLVGQVDVRSSATKPDTETYIALRRESIGVYPCLALVEYFHGLDIPGFVFENPYIREIETLAADLVLLQNDILSFHKEQDMGVNHNIIHLYRQDGFSQQEAYNRANGLLTNRYRQWYVAHANLPIWGEDIDLQVQKYLKGCQDVVLGNLNWSFKSERYFGKDNNSVRKMRVVRTIY